MRPDVRALCLVLAAFLTAPAWAQEFRSTISGRVVDESRAVIPGVKIVAVQTETGAQFETVSGHDGQYTLPFLLPGTYRISAETAGFKRYVHSGLTINANERK